jgi:hypothetical protein
VLCVNYFNTFDTEHKAVPRSLAAAAPRVHGDDASGLADRAACRPVFGEDALRRMQSARHASFVRPTWMAWATAALQVGSGWLHILLVDRAHAQSR